MTPTPLTDDELAVFERMTVVYPGAVARLSAGVPDAVARLLSEVRARRAADATGGTLDRVRDALASLSVCSHPTVCADAKCRAAGHEHEEWSEDRGGCAEGCPCLPACAGFEPDLCPASDDLCYLIERLDEMRARAGADEKGAGT